MATMTSYNPIFQEFPTDLPILEGNLCNLQVAKSVSSPGGNAKFNVVYESKFLGPNMSVEWTAKFALKLDYSPTRKR